LCLFPQLTFYAFARAHSEPIPWGDGLSSLSAICAQALFPKFIPGALLFIFRGLPFSIEKAMMQ
jgi:hypothetical protein